MDAIADFLIAVLEDFKEDSLPAQVMFVSFVLGLLFGPVLGLWRWTSARESRRAREAVVLRRDLKATQKAKELMQDEIDSFKRFDPEEALSHIQKERREGNRPKLIARADEYLAHHRVAFAEACRVLTDHHLSRYEDGRDALARARAACMGAIAADPQDRGLLWLLDEIETLHRLETEPPENEAEAHAKAERDRLRRLLRETPGHVDALSALARAEFARGRYRVAIALLERALDVAMGESATGPDSPLCLSIRAQIGEANIDAGRYGVADTVLSPLPDLCDRVLGNKEATTFFAKDCHARLLLQQGRAAEAETAWRKLLPLREKVQGPEHPGTLTTRHQIARALLHQGRAAEAETAWRKLRPLEEKVRGPEHPGTLTTRHEIARALLHQGRATEAETAWRKLLPLREKVQGPEHPSTLTTRFWIASAVLQQGRTAEAETAWRELLPLQEKVLGPDHPDHTLVTRQQIAACLSGQGRAAEAETALRDLLPLREKMQGPQHPHTLTTHLWIASALLDQGRAAEAETALRDLLPLEEKVQGAEHPDALDTRRALARAALEQGAADRARAALATLPEVGGDPNPLRMGKTAMLRGWLADLDGDATRATALLDAAEAHLAHLAPEHFARRELARYRETRVPGGAGGTMVWAETTEPTASAAT